MKRFVIERELPSIGMADEAALKGASGQSCDIIEAMTGENKQIEWERSYVTADKTFCVYRAADVGLIREHAERAGIPATTITEISAEIGPQTANG